jgi:hypothetical protein
VDIEVGDDAQQDRLGLVVGEIAHDALDGLLGPDPIDDRPGKVAAIRRLRWSVHVVVQERIGPVPGRPASMIDDATPGDREQPCPERNLVAHEPAEAQAPGHGYPDLTGQVVGDRGLAGAEVADQRWLIGAKQTGERPALTSACRRQNDVETRTFDSVRTPTLCQFGAGC